MEVSNEFTDKYEYYLETLTDHQKNQLSEALDFLPEGRHKGLWELLCTGGMQLNREQHEALLHSHEKQGPLLILAGPGSGKTAVMVRRIVFLLLRGVDPQNILAATFTNKAGREMQNRVQDLFGRAIEKCSPEEQSKLQKIEEKIEEAWIGTFHSLGQKILELELPGTEKIIIQAIN